MVCVVTHQVNTYLPMLNIARYVKEVSAAHMHRE